MIVSSLQCPPSDHNHLIASSYISHLQLSSKWSRVVTIIYFDILLYTRIRVNPFHTDSSIEYHSFYLARQTGWLTLTNLEAMLDMQDVSCFTSSKLTNFPTINIYLLISISAISAVVAKSWFIKMSKSRKIYFLKTSLLSTRFVNKNCKVQFSTIVDVKQAVIRFIEGNI